MHIQNVSEEQRNKMIIPKHLKNVARISQ